jgi:voltage-gated potassium channel
VNRRLAIIAAIYLGALLTAVAVFDFAEGKDFWSSAWWAVVTATTLGYGDLSPTTLVGRVVAIVLIHLTTLLVMPLLTAEIAAKLIVNSDAFTHDEQEEIKLTLRRLEAKVDALAAPPCNDAHTGRRVRGLLSVPRLPRVDMLCVEELLGMSSGYVIGPLNSPIGGPCTRRTRRRAGGRRLRHTWHFKANRVRCLVEANGADAAARLLRALWD